MCVLAESDSESVPTSSPTKQSSNRVVRVKTLEEIRLERIQAESAAYYSYPTEKQEKKEDDDLRNRITKRVTLRKTTGPDFKVLSLDEIRKRKNNESDEEILSKIPKISEDDNKEDEEGVIKIKTLAEIRAEREQRKAIKELLGDDVIMSDETDKIQVSQIDESFSQDRLITINDSMLKVPVKRFRSPDSNVKLTDDDISSTVSSVAFTDDTLVTSSTFECKRRRIGTVSPRTKPKLVRNKPEDEPLSTSSDNNNRLSPIDLVGMKTRDVADRKTTEVDVLLDSLDLDKPKTMDESLLLLDDLDDADNSVSLTAEEDILQNIDDILND